MSAITPERIAELRKQYPMMWSRNRDHHPFGHFAYSTLDINELLDALESSRAEADKAKRSLRAAGFTDNGGAMWKPPLGPSAAPLLDEVDRMRTEVQRLTVENQRLSDSLSKSIDGQIHLMQENIKWAWKYFRSAFPSEFAGKDSEI